MSWFDFLRSGRVPDEAIGASLLVATADTLTEAVPFLRNVEQRFGRLALGVVGAGNYAGPWPHVLLPVGTARQRLPKPAPARVILLGRVPGGVDLARAAVCPVYWLNAEETEAAQIGAKVITLRRPEDQASVPSGVVTGDPLLNIDGSAPAVGDPTFCERFKEFRERDQWVVYFAATGEEEEPLAYASFFQLLRRRAGLMALAPHDPARYEPVYRAAIPYRLPTNRHVRFMTSYVSHKTRVYFIEEPSALKAMYACADLVIAGGTLHAAAANGPDLVTPLSLGRATIVGPARRNDALVRAALEAGVIVSADDVEGLVGAAESLLSDVTRRQDLGARAHAWIAQHAGAAERVLALLA